MALKVLITGGSGLLGKYLIKTQPFIDFDGVAKSPMYEVTASYRNNRIDGIKIDVSNKSELLDRLWTLQPDIIIHCAANGDVDDVEKNPSEAVKSDLLGTIHIKEYCERMNCKLVAISSNAVYDGNNPHYGENRTRSPINIYGKIKSLADDIIISASCDYIIIRPMMMYGIPYEHGRGNWVNTIVNSLNNGKELKLVEDYCVQPTYAGDVAKAIWGLIEMNEWRKSFNLASNKTMSLFDMGRQIAQYLDLDRSLIKKAKLSDFNIAPRPIDTSFNTNLISNMGFKFLDLKEGVEQIINER